DCRNVQVVSKREELASLKDQMDLVLVDAPCTGSGTWRRRPDAKWRLSEKQLGVRTREQEEILDVASGYVKPGGSLVYITCSVFSEENGRQIEAFLSHRPEFIPANHNSLWEQHFPGLSGMARMDGAHGISLSPLLTGTDGFYFSSLL